jgi:aromatic-L-amino-acid/L-tryptophan decarboxylase
MRDESLDPTSWPEFRSLAHRVLEDLLDFQQHVRDRPVWQPVPASIDARFQSEAPVDGVGIERAYEDFREQVLPYATGNIHPRFWGWVAGTGTPSGMLAEMMSGGLNAIVGNFNDGASRVEGQVLRWMKSVFGFPEEASGILTSGGSVANLVGLAVARDVFQERPGTRKRDGAAPRLVLYASSEVHSSVFKAAKLLGLGVDAVRLVPVDRHHRIRMSQLEGILQRDRARGFQPFAIVGNAGTVNTGATDDLNALADLAAREGLWLHVDGAFGAMAALSPETRSQVAGLDRADSLAFDFHKWMYVPYEAGCVLIRDREGYVSTFSVSAPYLENLPRGVGAHADPANRRGPELSRGFKALKVWLHIREHGLAKLGRLVAQNVAQARHLAELVDRSCTLERLGPAPLNIVCFRYAPAGAPDVVVNQLNREILMRLQERGIAVPSSTVMEGKFAIRVAITNHRTRHDDLDLLVNQVEAIGAELGAVEATYRTGATARGLKARLA